MQSWMQRGTGPFLGRGDEVVDLLAVLADHRLVTLVGVGGVGKTRLAGRVAEEASAGMFETVYWAPLWQLSDLALFSAVVADACGLADHSARDPLDALCAWIGARRVLLVLDSCEHLVASCAALVAELLARCPGVAVLATSRQRLGGPEERVHRVEPLDPDTDGLALFTAGATAVGVRWDGPRDVVVAVEICRRLEGIPLALCLAAAQLPRQPVRVMARALRERLALAAPEDAGVRPERHRTLRTAIGWSHELCEPVERLLWARLSVFRAEPTLAAVERVCAGGPLTAGALPDALAGLERKSLVSVVGGRVRMLDTVREYGEMWLGQLGESDSVADRHARYFGELVARAEAGWWGPGQAAGYATVAASHADLCAAMERLLLVDPEDALRVAGALGFFWACCGRLHEAGHFLGELLRLVDAPHEVRAKALWALGVVRSLQGDYEGAARLGREARAAALAAGSGALVADAGYLQGLVMLLRGRPLAALHIADRELAAAAGPGSEAALARCRLVRVFGLTGSGHLDQARAEAEALRIRSVAIGEHWTRSYTEYQLALIALYEDRPDAAAGHARAMIREKRTIGDAFGIALGLDIMAAALAARGDGEISAQAFGAGQSLWETVGHPQRGTPELASLRARSQASARQAAGDFAYDKAYTWGRLTDPGATVETVLDLDR
ncbi:NB-ARC domain-containing protein [Streptomyces sp. NPDC047981]|uniref:ATP-binding protein n=1 Tax=Streptomyces sp. NPDC047981 TaxID=3154610 RepID=UPI0034365341